MKIREKTNLVIVGSWNLGILKPDWFKKEFEWKNENKNIPIELSLGSTNLIRFTLDDILIQPFHNRLELIANKEDDDIYESISALAYKILEKLPHTPINAIGQNRVYILEKNETFKHLQDIRLDDFKDIYEEKAESSTINTIEIKHVIEYEDHFLNIIYIINRKNSIIHLNFHYNIQSAVDPKNIITRFIDNIIRADKIVKNLIVEDV